MISQLVIDLMKCVLMLEFSMDHVAGDNIEAEGDLASWGKKGYIF